ncbi:MAG: DUF3127 domain-containing protein [Bacteroidetes bacterium]|uniref:DUF3127 domain-containing protein n=1 Tax=Candidatus Cryptobacteroides gallistercoris TaxID=2840765 RepID=A0A940IF06_9BACT|nr:DUF3127 domain-containing protein [Candidatus Cryptobacteroides gallistercoris]
MSLEIEGKIIRKLNVQTGVSQRGNWSKQEFIIEYQEGSYPSQACFNVWGEDKVKDLERFQIGDSVKVSFNVSSREYNGRWYTDLRAWRIDAAGSQPVSAPQTAAPAQETGNAQAAAAATAVPADDSKDDDLPF